MSLNRLSVWFAGVRQGFAGQDDMGWQDMFVLCCLYCAALAVFPLEPCDDLLRHMKAYAYGYDYRRMFPFSPGVPSFDMYLPFDVLVGHIHHFFGPYGFIIVQIAAIGLVAGAVYWLMGDATSRNLRFIATAAIVTACSTRLSLARPATFETGLFLLAIAACRDQRVKPWFHLVLGLVMAGFYYLFWIYLIPLVFYRRIYWVPLLAGIIGWAVYGGNDYVVVVQQLLMMKGTRGISISEAASLVGRDGVHPAILAASALFIPVFFYWRRDRKKLCATAWFILSNQVRYLEVIVPLLASYAQFWNIRLSRGVCLLLFCSLVFIRPSTKSADGWLVLHDAVPRGSRVLCLGMKDMFKVVYGNDHVQVSPCMEPGWDRQGVVAAMARYESQGVLDPSTDLRQYDFIIEDNLKQIPPSLRLYKVAGHYRVWSVLPP